MARRGKRASASRPPSDNRTNQGQQTPAADGSSDVSHASVGVNRPGELPIEGQQRPLDPQMRRHQQLLQQEIQQLRQLQLQQQQQRDQQSDSQPANRSSRPVRQSRRAQQTPQTNAWPNAQGFGYAMPPATFRTSPSFNNHNPSYGYGYNFNRNINVNMNTSGSYMGGNNLRPPHNPNTMVNFGWGMNYAMPSQAIVPPPTQQQDDHLVTMRYAQQLFMTQQMLGAMMNLNRLTNATPPTNNNNAFGMQQMRHMSTMANVASQPSVQQSPVNPAIATSDLATDAERISSNVPASQPKPKSNTVAAPIAPIPWPSYLDMARKEPKDLKFVQPLLIILDLNGTLLYRKRKKFPPQFIRRPALDQFLERLTSRHLVMVWSSSRPETVKAICDVIFTDSQKSKIVAKWARDKLGLDRSQYNAKVQVYKELEKVWADPSIQKKYPSKKDKAGSSLYQVVKNQLDSIDADMTGVLNRRWDQSNTVLIDDSTLKAAGNPYNILEVPEFTNDPNDDDSKVLVTVLARIKALSMSNNVSQRLRSWGDDGIKISRDKALASPSASESESESDSGSESEVGPGSDSSRNSRQQKRKLDELGESGELRETENRIMSRSLPEKAPQGNTTKRNRKTKGKEANAPHPSTGPAGRQQKKSKKRKDAAAAAT